MTCLRAMPRSSATGTYISRAVCLHCLRPLLLGTVQAQLALERRHKAHCLHQHLCQCPSCVCHSLLLLFCPCPARPPQYRVLRHQSPYVFPLFSVLSLCSPCRRPLTTFGYAFVLPQFLFTACRPYLLTLSPSAKATCQ